MSLAWLDWSDLVSIGNEMAGAGGALRLRDLLADLFELHDVTVTKSGATILRGRLLCPSTEAYRLAADRLRPLSCTPVFRREGQDDVIQVLPYLLSRKPARGWIGPLLFGLTVLSVLFAGAIDSGWDMSNLAGVAMGIPFAATLLAILGAHELGHYVVARHYGVPRSLPYFIPMPISPFGTMGAVIRLDAPPTNRRVLLAIAAAGPLSGLVVALPLLVLGLHLSVVGPVLTAGGVQEGNSLLYAALKFLVFGRWLPGGGLDVLLHPVAFAAWSGLLVTALNLIPAGQLDGGHILYVLVGERARYVTYGLVAILAVLGALVYEGWLMWAVIILFLGRAFATPLDSITPLKGKHVALAVFMLLVFVLIFTPAPLRLV